MTMDTKVLEKIGLTRNQSEVYLALLKLGSTTAQQIIKESGMHRSRGGSMGVAVEWRAQSLRRVFFRRGGRWWIQGWPRCRRPPAS